MQKRICGRTCRIVVLLIATGLALGSCTFLNVVKGVPFNKVIEGEITFSDKSSQDSNDYYFYYDWYEIWLDSSRSYSLEMWTDRDVPIHFESKDLGIDVGAWDDGDGSWDGHLLYALPEGLSQIGFDFYLRADSVGSDSWYRFQIIED